MRYIRYSVILVGILIALPAFCQMQKGYVKTLGRPDKKGEALNGVSVRVKGEHNPVLSQQDGTFSMLMTERRNGDAYTLQEVKKKGYELNESDVIGRQYAFSDKVPLTIVMVSSALLQADKQRIENNAFKVAEKNYKSKLELLEKQKAESVITEEQYRKELLDLQDKFEKYQLLIDGLAEHYAHVDYDELNDKEREINICIENGELERADSLIKTLFDPIDVLKRNREALAHLNQQISEANTIIDKANEDMATVLKQQEKDANYLYQLYTIALSRFNNDKARQYIETRAELDTSRCDWQNEAGMFYGEYMADLSMAIFYFQRAINSAYKNNQEDKLPSYFANLGHLYSNLSNYNDAIKYYEKAIDIINRKEGYDTPLVGVFLDDLSVLYSKQGEFEKSIVLCKKALRLKKQLFGDISEPVATCFNKLGGLYMEKGDLSKAKEIINQSLDLWKQIKKKDSIDMADCYNNLGNLYSINGDFEEALNYYSSSLEIYEKAYGNNHPNIALMCNNIGQMYNDINENQKALISLKRALTIWTNFYGENHIDVASCLNNIGSVYSSLHDYPKALSFYGKACKIKEQLLGDNNPETAVSYNNLGTTYLSMGDLTNALKYSEKALKIRRMSFGDNHFYVGSSYNNIGSIYMKLGNFSEALNNYKKAENIYLNVFNENNYHMANVFGNIACAYDSIGEYTIALQYCEKALPIMIQTYGNEHIQVVSLIHEMGNLYCLMENYEKAITFHDIVMDYLISKEGKSGAAVSNYSQYLLFDYYNALSKQHSQLSFANILFIATVIDDDNPARQQGMDGEYVVLKFADWAIDSTLSLFDINSKMRGKPKTIVVMKDGKISQHSFENTIGIQLSLKYLDKAEKGEIVKLYKEWELGQN